MKKVIIFLALMTLAAGCNKVAPTTTTGPSPAHNGYTQKLKVGEQTLDVEIASTEPEMEQGLSGRDSLSDEQGMLFDFGTQQSAPGFWMKDMKFNLDFIWINNKKIIGITADVPAPIKNSKLEIGNLPLYYPPSPVNQVLEINAGWAKKNHLQIGDDVDFQNQPNYSN